MASNRGFFEPCWTLIYPDAGGPVERQDFTAPLPHPLSVRFHFHKDRVGELHDRKQSDYGRSGDPFYNLRQTEQWGIPAWVGALIRLDDKVGRLRNLISSGSDPANESVEDSLDDIAAYAIIARTLLEEESARSGQVLVS